MDGITATSLKSKFTLDIFTSKIHSTLQIIDYNVRYWNIKYFAHPCTKRYSKMILSFKHQSNCIYFMFYNIFSDCELPSFLICSTHFIFFCMFYLTCLLLSIKIKFYKCSSKNKTFHSFLQKLF